MTYGKDVGDTKDTGDNARRDDATPHWCAHIILRSRFLVEVAEDGDPQDNHQASKSDETGRW